MSIPFLFKLLIALALLQFLHGATTTTSTGDVSLVFQSNLQAQDYSPDTSSSSQNPNFKKRTSHRIVVTALQNSIPLPGAIVVVKLIHNTPTPPYTLIVTSLKSHLEPIRFPLNTEMTLQTNEMGKLILALPIQEDKDNHDSGTGQPPILYARTIIHKNRGSSITTKRKWEREEPEFGEWHAVSFGAAAVSKLAGVDGKTLKKASNTHLDADGDDNGKYDDAAALVRRLMHSVHHHHQQEQNQRDHTTERILLKKRSPLPDSNYIPYSQVYDASTNQVYSQVQARGLLFPHGDSSSLYFNNEPVKSPSIKNSALQRREQEFTPAPTPLRLRHHKSFTNNDSTSDLVISGESSVFEAIGSTLGSTVSHLASTGVHMVFDLGHEVSSTASHIAHDPSHTLKYLLNGAGEMGETIVNATANAVIDTVFQTPVDLMKAVATADSIHFAFLASAANTLQTYIVTPSRRILSFALASASEVWAVCTGILTHLNVLVRFLMELIADIWDWKAVVRTTRFLTHHFSIMVPYARIQMMEQNRQVLAAVGNVTNFALASGVEIPAIMQTNGEQEYLDLHKAATSDNETIRDGEASSSPASSSSSSKLQPLQSTYLRDMSPNLLNSLHESSTSVKESDKNLIRRIVEIIRSTMAGTDVIVKHVVDSAGAVLHQCSHHASSSSTTRWTDLVTMVKLFTKVLLDGVLDLATDLALKVGELILQLFDSIMSYHVQIPFITWLFEDEILGASSSVKLTFYSLLSLFAAFPITVLGNAITDSVTRPKTNHQQQLEWLSEREVNQLVTIQDPAEYLSVWNTDFKRLAHQNVSQIAPLLERKRNTLSHIIGSVYVETTFLKALATTVSLFSSSAWSYLLQGPFQFVTVLALYPHEWLFLGLEDMSHKNIRVFGMDVKADTITFFGWFVKIFPLVFGFMGSSSGFGLNIGTFKSVLDLVIELVSVISVLYRDIALGKTDFVRNSKYSFDIFTKAGANVAEAIGALLSSTPVPLQVSVFGKAVALTGTGLVMGAAVTQGIRLAADIAINQVFSV